MHVYMVDSVFYYFSMIPHGTTTCPYFNSFILNSKDQKSCMHLISLVGGPTWRVCQEDWW